MPYELKKDTVDISAYLRAMMLNRSRIVSTGYTETKNIS